MHCSKPQFLPWRVCFPPCSSWLSWNLPEAAVLSQRNSQNIHSWKSQRRDSIYINIWTSLFWLVPGRWHRKSLPNVIYLLLNWIKIYFQGQFFFKSGFSRTWTGVWW
jgi:hypothetical protein